MTTSIYARPGFWQSIFDILLQFCLHPIVVAGDIEKAFLMVSVKDDDKDALGVLWVCDSHADDPEIVVLRFARVAFGVSSSPLLLNATIKYHIEKYQGVNPMFVKNFLFSTYVDDVSLGGSEVALVFKEDAWTHSACLLVYISTWYALLW